MLKKCVMILLLTILTVFQPTAIFAQTALREARPERFAFGNEDDYDYTNPDLKRVESFQYGMFVGAEEYSYDLNGKKTEIKHIDSQGEDNYKTCYSYSDTGLLLGITEYSFRSGGMSSQKVFEYTLDGKPRIFSEYLYDFEGNEMPTDKREFFYDQKGILVEYKVYDENNEVRIDGMVDADAYGTIHSINWNNSQGQPTFSEYWEYDERNDITMYSNTQADGSYTYSYSYQYDDTGRLIRRDFSGEDQHYSLYSYDEKGNLIRRADFSSDGHLGASYEFDYDVNGNLIEKRELDYSGMVITQWIYIY